MPHHAMLLMATTPLGLQARAMLPVKFFPEPVQVLAVRVLQFENRTTASGSGILEYSENGKAWVKAYDVSHAFDTGGEWGQGTLPYSSMGGLIWYLIFIIFF